MSPLCNYGLTCESTVIRAAQLRARAIKHNNRHSFNAVEGSYNSATLNLQCVFTQTGPALPSWNRIFHQLRAAHKKTK